MWLTYDATSMSVCVWLTYDATSMSDLVVQ